MTVKKDKLFGIQRSTKEDYYELHAELSLIKKYLAMSLTVHFKALSMNDYQTSRLEYDMSKLHFL